MNTIKFFESEPGNRSSSRLIAFVVVVVALIYSGLIIYWGRETIVQAAAASGTLFLTVAGSAMVFLFNQKKTENSKP